MALSCANLTLLFFKKITFFVYKLFGVFQFVGLFNKPITTVNSPAFVDLDIVLWYCKWFYQITWNLLI